MQFFNNIVKICEFYQFFYIHKNSLSGRGFQWNINKKKQTLLSEIHTQMKHRAHQLITV